MFVHPLVDGPTALKVGPVSVHFYGVIYLFSFFIYQRLGEYRLKTSKWLTDNEWDTLFHYSIISILIGGRIGDIIFYRLHDLLDMPLIALTNRSINPIILLLMGLSLCYRFFTGVTIPALSIGFLLTYGLLFLTFGYGMSFHGALVGGIIAVMLYSCRFKKNWLDILDFISPLIPPGLGFGRIANFLNGELWGRPTNMPWGVIFPRADFEVRHPSQLYESALEGIFLFIILWSFSKNKKPRGTVFGLAITLYAIFRIFVEFFREPTQDIGFIAWGWVTIGQLLSLPMLLGGLFLLGRAYHLRNHLSPKIPLSTKSNK